MNLRSNKPFIELDGEKVTRQILFASHKDRTISFPNYLQAGYKPLTLALLVNGYYDNPDLRESIKDYPGCGEYTSTLLVDGEEFVENPEIVFNPQTRLWELKNGQSKKVELPEDGVFRCFDVKTGLPSKTGRHVADEYSILPPYFKREDRDVNSLQGVHTIIRFHGQYQPLVINVTHELNESVPHIGARMMLSSV